MAIKKISELTENTALADGDMFPVVDVSDTPDATERVTLANLRTGVLLTASGLTSIGADGSSGISVSGGGIYPAVDNVDESGYSGLRWSNVYSMQYQAANWIEKGADEGPVTDTTLQTDDHLTTSLSASSKYHFKFTVFVSCAASAEGFKAAVTGTVGVTSLKAQIKVYDDVTANALAAFGRITAIDTSVGAVLPAGTHYAEIEGTIETSTAGTFALSWAEFAVGAGAGVTVQRNSSLIVHRCA